MTDKNTMKIDEKYLGIMEDCITLADILANGIQNEFIFEGAENPLPLREWDECDPLKNILTFCEDVVYVLVGCITDHTNIE